MEVRFWQRPAASCRSHHSYPRPQPDAGAQWTARPPGAPLLVGALAAIDCEVEDIVERHSHAIVIGGACGLKLSGGSSALAYWQGQYVAIDLDEEGLRK